MTKANVVPSFRAESFNCPRCGAFAAMKWNDLLLNSDEYASITFSTCAACRKPSVWIDDDGDDGMPTPGLPMVGLLGGSQTLIFPHKCIAPQAEEDMPDDVKIDFEEARQVFNHSPRASAALLRLCVQKLCQQLLGKKGDIHKQIGELVEIGLPPRVLKAFDTIRIFGNESVHPGTLNLNDTPEVALALFTLLNMAVRHCITEETELETIRALTPENKRRDL
ncbi:DUF4145 domain-containing protein [Pseudomonas sp. COW5]|uniref:DUF4145 domain-containing protein n=1 Tax=Pseudomonas sp. COW5 TaxID=2981253 RepID=UPI0022484B9C|nr:DUF4145 domain-containing protein [Pseudomonas sp. COW5]MCX2546591.1 DUF4145 domain-containing protein [Pseudomonas sp. COW5]